MKRILVGLIMLGLVVPVIGAPEVIRKSGDCKLQVAGAFDDDKLVKVAIKDPKVELLCKFRGGEFFGKFMLFANPHITNKAGKKINVSYSVAFLDKAGNLVACASQAGDVDAGAKDHQFGSCLAKVPKAEFDKIASYKIVVYVSDAK